LGQPSDLTNAIHPPTRAEWRSWPEQHHTRRQGIWLISYKKATGKPRADYDEAVEEALCFGWIDSKLTVELTRRKQLWIIAVV
jgi:uncharacterized protein YdeI (YjbR/CyaY-like superfamily)